MIDFVKKGGSSLYMCQSCGDVMPYRYTDSHAGVHMATLALREERQASERLRRGAVVDPFAGEEWEDYG